MQEMVWGHSCTFVEIVTEGTEAGTIAGYFTLRADSLEILCRNYDPSDGEDDETIDVPLIELMYLARDIKWRGYQVGKLLVGDAMQTVYDAMQRIGAIGLHLRSTPEAIRLYREYDFRPFIEHPQADSARFILPRSDIVMWGNTEL